jgi:hypothetical protein
MPAQSQSQSQGGGWQGQSGGGYQQQGSGGANGSSLFVPGAQFGNWWPADLGVPGSTGAQNNLRYAYFPGACRLAIDVGGQISVYDTGNHQIGGFSQQQSGDQSITFTSQFGLVRVADLSRINPANPANAGTNPNQSFASEPEKLGPTPQQAETAPVPEAAVSPAARNDIAPAASDDIFSLIEKLADLHKKGVLTDREYESKKGELLTRL